MSADPPERADETAQRAFGYEPMPAPAREPLTVRASSESTALAGWWPRAAALVLDSLVLVAVALPIVIATILLADTTDELVAELIAYAVVLPLALAYAPLLMMRAGPRNGQTLGKQATGIRVVREDGAPITLGKALVREVVGRQLLAWITFSIYSLFDYLWPLSDKRNQALHDKIAGTLVVLATPQTAAPSAPGEQPITGWLPPQAG
jgi:uncharacterized RDD family membrane protein YckC